MIKSSRNAFDSKITIGRARNNDIVLRAGKISKFHAMFILETGNGLKLVDMASANGTRINGVRLKTGGVLLKDGDKIAFWRFDFKFVETRSFVRFLRGHKPPSLPMKGKGKEGVSSRSR